MSEATQTYFALGTETEETDNGFYTALNYIRENANTQLYLHCHRCGYTVSIAQFADVVIF